MTEPGGWGDDQSYYEDESSIIIIIVIVIVIVIVIIISSSSRCNTIIIIFNILTIIILIILNGIHRYYYDESEDDIDDYSRKPVFYKSTNHANHKLKIFIQPKIRTKSTQPQCSGSDPALDPARYHLHCWRGLPLPNVGGLAFP